MTKLDDKLEEIIDKYSIYNCYPDYRNQRETECLLYELFEKLEGSGLAFRGGGYHLFKLLKFTEKREGPIYIVDKNSTLVFEDKKLQLISIDDIQRYNISTIVIASYQYREEMEIELYNLKLEGVKIINIYAYLEQNGIQLSTEFYNVHRIGYEEIFLHKKRYEYSTQESDKEFYLRKIIADYVSIKDFLNLEKSIKIYQSKKYSEHDRYTYFWNEVKAMLDEAKQCIQSKTHKNIIINWVDGLGEKQVQDMPFLSELLTKGLWFQNAYTVMPWTRMTLATMMTHQYVIEDAVWKIDEINEDNAVVLQYLEQQGYRFIYIGVDKYKKEGFFSEKHTPRIHTYDYECSTRYQWVLLNELCTQMQKSVYIVHNVIETHDPFIGGEATQMKTGVYDTYNFNATSVQPMESRTYIDSQLKYYAQYLNEDDDRIYLSDHGMFNLNPTSDDKLHIFMLVLGKDILPKQYSELYSCVNFIYLIKYLVSRDEAYLQNCFSDYIKIQILDIYASESIHNYMKLCDTRKDIYILKNMLQSQGIRGKLDKYIKYAYGEERYYILPDEKTNLIDKEEYQDRIEFLRNKIANDKWIPLLGKFENARTIYNKLEIQMQEIQD
ncbi:MAG: sulfatase-like hydrolase/transferase [Lachnospiraceae bacterium]